MLFGWGRMLFVPFEETVLADLLAESQVSCMFTSQDRPWTSNALAGFWVWSTYLPLVGHVLGQKNPPNLPNPPVNCKLSACEIPSVSVQENDFMTWEELSSTWKSRLSHCGAWKSNSGLLATSPAQRLGMFNVRGLHKQRLRLRVLLRWTRSITWGF